MILIRCCCLGRSPLSLPAAAVITRISPTSISISTTSSTADERPDRRGEEAGQPGGEAASAGIAVVPIIPTSTNTTNITTCICMPTPIPRAIPRQAQGQSPQSAAGPMPALQHQDVVSPTQQLSRGG